MTSSSRENNTLAGDRDGRRENKTASGTNLVPRANRRARRREWSGGGEIGFEHIDFAERVRRERTGYRVDTPRRRARAYTPLLCRRFALPSRGKKKATARGLQAMALKRARHRSGANDLHAVCVKATTFRYTADGFFLLFFPPPLRTVSSVAILGRSGCAHTCCGCR